MEEQTQIEQTESVEYKLTSKGVSYWDIKVRDKMLSEDTINRLVNIDTILKAKFPNNVTSVSS